MADQYFNSYLGSTRSLDLLCSFFDNNSQIDIVKNRKQKLDGDKEDFKKIAIIYFNSINKIKIIKQEIHNIADNEYLCNVNSIQTNNKNNTIQVNDQIFIRFNNNKISYIKHDYITQPI